MLGSADPLAVTELEPDPNSGAKDGVAFASVVLLFLAIQLAGAYIMMGVFEEKSTKVVELVLAAVRARDLLAGKVLGIGLLGLIQVLTLVVASVRGGGLRIQRAPDAVGLAPGDERRVVPARLRALRLGVRRRLVARSPPGGRPGHAGTDLDRVDAELLRGHLRRLVTGLGRRQVISWIPLTAPFSMPGRLAAGGAAAWEVAGSMVITAIAAFGVLLLAERIYVRSVIHTDRKLGWREAWSMRD
ncbi:MAG: ABC transporter permease [Ilumatobacteraceae bacterium]